MLGLVHELRQLPVAPHRQAHGRLDRQAGRRPQRRPRRRDRRTRGHPGGRDRRPEGLVEEHRLGVGVAVGAVRGHGAFVVARAHLGVLVSSWVDLAFPGYFRVYLHILQTFFADMIFTFFQIY